MNAISPREFYIKYCTKCDWVSLYITRWCLINDTSIYITCFKHSMCQQKYVMWWPHRCTWCWSIYYGANLPISGQTCDVVDMSICTPSQIHVCTYFEYNFDTHVDLICLCRMIPSSGWRFHHYQTCLSCASQWHHTEHDDVSNHQPHQCLLSRLFGRRSKKTSKLRVTGLCAGNSPGTGEFPAQTSSNAEMFPFDDVIMVHPPRNAQRNKSHGATRRNNRQHSMSPREKRLIFATWTTTTYCRDRKILFS